MRSLVLRLIPVVWTLCAAGSPVFAQDVTQHGTQPGLAVELDAPQNCLSCHGSFGQSGNEFLPHDGWSGSMMAHATRDPLFWAALDVANDDVPGVGDWCLRCHAPQGWFGGRVRKNGSGGFVNGTNGCLLQGDHDDEDGPDSDYSGVTCHYCHRMDAKGPTGQTAPPGSGNAWIDDTLQCTANGNSYFGPCRKGPRAYAPNDPLEAPHGWAYSAFTASSAICGTCHDVSSPIVDGVPLKTLVLNDGTVTTRAYPAERTFTEWKQSRFGDALLVDSMEDPGVPFAANVQVTDCQDCHMRKSTSPQARTCQQNPAGSRTGQVSIHEFVGGNTWMLGIIKGLYGGPTQLNRGLALDRAIAWSQEMLTERSAELALTVQPWSSGQSTLTANVRVTNKAGHKLPTGYGEGRRMWLNVQVRDAGGALVYESGRYDAATGQLTEDAQIRLYEVLQGQWNAGSGTCRMTDTLGRKQFHFVLNDCVAKDSRIPPEGFRLYSGDDPQGLDIRPVGKVYPETTPGSGVLVHWDDASYTVPIPPGTQGPLQVTARLRFQIASKEYIEFLRNTAVESDPPFPSEDAMCGRTGTVGPRNKSRGVFMYDLWNDPTYGKSPPVDMRSASATTVAASR
jgi:hypothetical protein